MNIVTMKEVRSRHSLRLLEAKGTTVEDGITYNVYELWDGRVHIEQGITVVHTKRDLGKL